MHTVHLVCECIRCRSEIIILSKRPPPSASLVTASCGSQAAYRHRLYTGEGPGEGRWEPSAAAADPGQCLWPAFLQLHPLLVVIAPRRPSSSPPSVLPPSPRPISPSPLCSVLALPPLSFLLSALSLSLALAYPPTPSTSAALRCTALRPFTSMTDACTPIRTRGQPR